MNEILSLLCVLRPCALSLLRAAFNAIIFGRFFNLNLFRESHIRPPFMLVVWQPCAPTASKNFARVCCLIDKSCIFASVL